MKRLARILGHIFAVSFLTLLTQIGGVIYIIAGVIINTKRSNHRYKRLAVFAGLYLLTTLLIIPAIAPLLGREKINNSELVQAHSLFFTLANRNYVRPELNTAIQSIAKELNSKHKGIKLIYLDANFPFIDTFPLLPHLSHNDGKKIDVTLIYEIEEQLTNKKPTVSGYGVFESPTTGEYNQIDVCKDRGYWQYDFPKHLTMGTINSNLDFSITGTKNLANSILKQSSIGKVFIEPHLKNRLNLNNPKVRFHGCQAVRHDDHIHFQLK